MDDFPDFMKHPANLIAKTAQATPGVEGYVFDGADGSQMAFWTCRQTAPSAAHAHEHDEYTGNIPGQRMEAYREADRRWLSDPQGEVCEKGRLKFAVLDGPFALLRPRWVRLADSLGRIFGDEGKLRIERALPIVQAETVENSLILLKPFRSRLKDKRVTERNTSIRRQVQVVKRYYTARPSTHSVLLTCCRGR